MGSNYKKLGEYIRQVDTRNSEGRLGEENLYGISVTKEFIISHANLVGVTFDSYKVVSPRQFAYIPDTSRRGDKIAISLNMFGEDIIVSSICSVFEIIDEDQLLPEYLLLWFMRPEFDRYARFMSNGSAREVFDWDSMCGVELPVPPISEQRKIVHDYQVITNRIELLRKVDNNLFQTAKTYMARIYEMDEFWSSETSIGEYCDNIASGGTPNRSESCYWENASIPWLKNGEIKNNVIVDTEEYISKSGLENSSARLFPAYSVHMAMYCVSEIQVAVSCIPLTTNQAVLNFGFNSFRDASFFYYLLATYGNGITTNANGSAQQNLSKELITAYIFKRPIIEKTVFSYFEQNLQYRIVLAKELHSLQESANVVLSHI